MPNPKKYEGYSECDRCVYIYNLQFFFLEIMVHVIMVECGAAIENCYFSIYIWVPKII